MSSIPPAPQWRCSQSRWEAACAGDIPAEMLPPRDRENLVEALHALGWTDQQIGAHTHWTEYTVARIRARMGLDANKEGAA